MINKNAKEMMKKWLVRKDSSECPFYSDGSSVRNGRYIKLFCNPICKKYFPRSRDEFPPCPCMHYKKSSVVKMAQRIVREN